MYPQTGITPSITGERQQQMAQKRVSERQAKAVLKQLRKAHNVDEAAVEPKLYDADHEGLPDGCWSIIWEGGPEGWAPDFRSEVEGVFAEAYNYCILNLYPVS